jgi:hypothetical protein
MITLPLGRAGDFSRDTKSVLLNKAILKSAATAIEGEPLPALLKGGPTASLNGPDLRPAFKPTNVVIKIRRRFERLSMRAGAASTSGY